VRQSSPICQSAWVRLRPSNRATALPKQANQNIQSTRGTPCRYFTHQELHELFKITPEGLQASETQQMLTRTHATSSTPPAAGGGSGGAAVVAAGSVVALAKGDQELMTHLEWVEANPGCAGTSDHAALFNEQDPEGQRLERAGQRHRDAAAAADGFFGSGATAAAAGASQRGRGGGGGRMGRGAGGRGGGAAGGWQGAGDLSDMLSGLGIGERAPPGHDGGSNPWGASDWDPEAFAQQQRVAALRRRAQELSEAAAQAAATATSLGRSLPDGGAKVRVWGFGVVVILFGGHRDLREALENLRSSRPTEY